MMSINPLGMISVYLQDPLMELQHVPSSQRLYMTLIEAAT